MHDRGMIQGELVMPRVSTRTAALLGTLIVTMSIGTTLHVVPGQTVLTPRAPDIYESGYTFQGCTTSPTNASASARLSNGTHFIYKLCAYTIKLPAVGTYNKTDDGRLLDSKTGITIFSENNKTQLQVFLPVNSSCSTALCPLQNVNVRLPWFGPSQMTCYYVYLESAGYVIVSRDSTVTVGTSACSTQAL